MSPSATLRYSHLAMCINDKTNGVAKSKTVAKSADGVSKVEGVGQMPSLVERLGELFAENVIAKMVRVAQDALRNNDPPTHYPEWVPQSGEHSGIYDLREKDFWTCGFFPGTLYSLLERATRHPQAFPCGQLEKSQIRSHLVSLARTWARPIHEMATRTDTHDIGFIIQPSLRVEWELFGDEISRDRVFTAAHSLASRYNPIAKAIRSWDVLDQNGRLIDSMEQDFLVIIDSMMNLDLLFYAAHHLSNPRLAAMATTHAQTVARANLRPENKSAVPSSPFQGQLYSTFHVVNISPLSGFIKAQMTAQGYADHTTWARGQAWGIFGYAQTYQWTKDTKFLDLSCGLAEYFIARLEESPALVERSTNATDTEVVRSRKMKGRYVPLWDFDAPIDEAVVLRDSSAGVIAANGMLILYQALSALGRVDLARWYLEMATTIVEDTLAFSLSLEKAEFGSLSSSEAEARQSVAVSDTTGERFDAILKNATANYNAKDHRRYWDHGLVYGDYYLLEFGNRLLRMGLV